MSQYESETTGTEDGMGHGDASRAPEPAGLDRRRRTGGTRISEAPGDRAFIFVRISRWLVHAEGLIYFAVGGVLILAAGVLLASVLADFWRMRQGEVRTLVLQMLDSLLLVLMLVEILHTVGISLRSHELVPEPFLIVGLISAIRRVLVITAEQQPLTTAPAQFQMTLLELGLLTFTIMALVVAIYLLRRQAAPRLPAEPGQRAPAPRA